MRRLIAGLCALTVLIGLTGFGLSRVQAQSGENSRYAAIVVDAGTGEVLFARHADSRRYPASVTKMMTLYLVFEALEKGTADLDDVLTISPLAASQPPSKLGQEPACPARAGAKSSPRVVTASRQVCRG